MSPRPGVCLPQRHAGKAPVHDDQHSGSLVGHLDRQLRLAAVEPAHRRVDLRVCAALGQRHHPRLREPRGLAILDRPAEYVPVGRRIRHIQHEPVYCGQAHPAIEGALQTDGSQRAGQLAEQRLQDRGSPDLLEQGFNPARHTKGVNEGPSAAGSIRRHRFLRLARKPFRALYTYWSAAIPRTAQERPIMALGGLPAGG